jgi:L-ascorbate metabolism protein UlaG (beta-lactamase superfamily)
MRTQLMAVVVGALLTLGGTAAAQGAPAAPAQGTPAAGKAGAKGAAAAKGPAAAKGKLEVTWWGHAAFVVRTPGGAVIAIDPWLTNPKAPQGVAQPEALDAILVSHGHFDHVGETKALAQKTGAKVFGSFELINLLGLPEAQADPKGASQYAGAPLGFVIAIDNGPTLYHAGDTGAFAGMEIIAAQFKPTVAMLPIGGHFTMGPAEAAQAARLLKVQSIVPMHYGTFPLLQGTPDALRGELKTLRGPAKVLDLEPGKATAL